MKTEYEYIKFVEKEKLPKTTVYSCQEKKSGVELGIVKWYGPWQKYFFSPSTLAVYDRTYLLDIADFINQLHLVRKKRSIIMNTETGEIKALQEIQKLDLIEQEKFIPMEVPPTQEQMKRNPPKVGVNELCPCGSGKKFKKCHYTGQ